MRKYFFVILIILCALISVNAVLFAPNEASYSYWFSVAWLFFLVFCNWYTSAALFSSPQRTTVTGITGSDAILPGAGIAIFLYSVLSASLIFFFHVGILSLRIHLAIQVTALGATALVVLFQLIAAKSASWGNDSAHSKQEILALARSIRMRVDPEELAHIDKFIEFVEYRMPHPAKLNQAHLKKAVEYLCNVDLSPSERTRLAQECLYM